MRKEILDKYVAASKEFWDAIFKEDPFPEEMVREGFEQRPANSLIAAIDRVLKEVDGFSDSHPLGISEPDKARLVVIFSNLLEEVLDEEEEA